MARLVAHKSAQEERALETELAEGHLADASSDGALHRVDGRTLPERLGERFAARLLLGT